MRSILSGRTKRVPVPLESAKSSPLPGGGILFLVDDAAPPVFTDKVMAPLPSRLFPLSSEDRLVDHVRRLEEEERQACQRIYSQGAPA
jgi:hypothetical protein